MMLLEKYPGIQGLGYSLRIRPHQWDTHIKQMRREGFSHYQPWPLSRREERHSIIYLEPFDWRNKRAFGYDMSTDIVRKEAMEKSRDTGLITLSGKVHLVQEIKNREQPGFLIYLPLYQGGQSPATLSERRKSLLGLIFAPFRAQDLFSNIFHHFENAQMVNFAIFDGKKLDKENLIFINSPYKNYKKNLSPRYVEESHIVIGGRPLSLTFQSTPLFEGHQLLFFPLLTAILGLFISFLLFHHLKQTKKIFLQEQESRKTLELLIQIGRNFSSELELKKLVQDVTDMATTLAKAQFGGFFYNVENEQGDSYMLYTISGVSVQKFNNFPMPRKTELFGPTFSGLGPLRSDDIKKDSRFGKNSPYFGYPKGHLPVTSYLAVPVISRSGAVIGGLFLGHEKKGIFSVKEEEIVIGLANQAAVAIDNAKIFQKAQEKIMARDEFLTICGHELKTPLTSLKLHTQIVERDLKKDIEKNIPFDHERIKGLINTSHRQIERLSKLVEVMLDIGRISTGYMIMNPERIELSPLIEDIVERLSYLAMEKGSVVKINHSLHPIKVHWDKLRIEQVIINLLSNAIKYGSGNPVEISLIPHANHAVIITIKDQGIGIDCNHLQRIFNRFERAVSSSKVSGLGLGLYIVRKILDGHDGLVTVESELGKGSTFRVEIPLNPDFQSEEKPKTYSNQVPSSSQPLSSVEVKN